MQKGAGEPRPRCAQWRLGSVRTASEMSFEPLRNEENAGDRDLAFHARGLHAADSTRMAADFDSVDGNVWDGDRNQTTG
jgi:hypothetical protein